MVHIYTDGSKFTEGVGFTVFPNTTSGGRLTGEASIFTAELYAINAAVHEIFKGTGRSEEVEISRNITFSEKILIESCGI